MNSKRASNIHYGTLMFQCKLLLRRIYFMPSVDRRCRRILNIFESFWNLLQVIFSTYTTMPHRYIYIEMHLNRTVPYHYHNNALVCVWMDKITWCKWKSFRTIYEIYESRVSERQPAYRNNALRFCSIYIIHLLHYSRICIYMESIMYYILRMSSIYTVYAYIIFGCYTQILSGQCLNALWWNRMRLSIGILCMSVEAEPSAIDLLQYAAHALQLFACFFGIYKIFYILASILEWVGDRWRWWWWWCDAQKVFCVSLAEMITMKTRVLLLWTGKWNWLNVI